MIIGISKHQKIMLLKGIKEGVFDSDVIPELHDSKLSEPLTPAQAKAYLYRIEHEC